MRIVLIDDDQLVCMSLKIILEADDEIEVVAVGNDGADAVPLYNEHQPDIEELTFDKGCCRDTEQYSGYEGINSAGQPLSEILELMDTTDVFVCGIATEFCVRNTCKDLKDAGYNVHLLSDCLAYVDHDGHLKALDEMAAEGISIE